MTKIITAVARCAISRGDDRLAERRGGGHHLACLHLSAAAGCQSQK
jgi:hypothetical protein